MAPTYTQSAFHKSIESNGREKHGLTITDAQIHAWFPDSGSTQWPMAGREYVQSAKVRSSAERAPFSADELVAELDRVGVDSAILVPPLFAGDDNTAALKVAHQYPDRFSVMGRLALADEISKNTLRSWSEEPGMAGVRLTFFWQEHRKLLDEGGADWFWPEAEDLGIPVAVLSPGRLRKIGDIARRHPGLKIIVDHFGMDLDLKNEDAFEALDELIPLASLPNIAVKASTLPSYVTEAYPFPSLHDPIHRVVDAFGPQRVFWGSEMTRLPCPYEECLTLFTEQLDFLNHEDLEWIMGQGLREWLEI